MPERGEWEEVVARIEALEERLARIEARLRMAADAPREPGFERLTPPPVPPPVIEEKPDPEAETAASYKGAEYTIGSRILPRVGGTIFVLGILYLVGLGIQQGWLTPVVQFLIGLAISLAFIGTGIKRQEEKAEFGHLLVGIGAAGLYVTLGAGHVLQGLYPAEVMIVLFLLLSGMLLAYSLRHESKTFYGMGTAGALAGIVMVLSHGQLTTAAILDVIVLFACLSIAIHQRWAYAGLVLWIGTLVVPTSVGFGMTPGAGLPYLGVALLYTHTLLCWLAYALSIEDDPIDRYGVFPTAYASVTAILSLSLVSGMKGLLPLGIFLALLAGMGAYFRSKPAVSSRLLFAAAFVGTVILPYVWPAIPRIYIQAVLTGALSLISVRLSSRLLLGLSAAPLVVATGTYLDGTQFHLNQRTELMVLVFLMTATVVITIAVARVLRIAQPSVAIGAALLLPFTMRLVLVLRGYPEGPSEQSTYYLTFLSYTLGVSLLAWIGQNRWLLALAWVLFAMTVALFLLYEIYHKSLPVEVTSHAILLATVAVLTKTSMQLDEQPGLLLAVGWAIAFPFFSRIVYLLSTLTPLHAGATLTTAWVGYASAALLVGLLSNHRELRVLSFMLFFLTVGKLLFVDLWFLDPLVRVVVLMLAGLAMILGGYWYLRLQRES